MLSSLTCNTVFKHFTLFLSFFFFFLLIFSASLSCSWTWMFAEMYQFLVSVSKSFPPLMTFSHIRTWLVNFGLFIPPFYFAAFGTCDKVFLPRFRFPSFNTWVFLVDHSPFDFSVEGEILVWIQCFKVNLFTWLFPFTFESYMRKLVWGWLIRESCCGNFALTGWQNSSSRTTTSFVCIYRD